MQYCFFVCLFVVNVIMLNDAVSNCVLLNKMNNGLERLWLE
jgi:hypothetical protein